MLAITEAKMDEGLAGQLQKILSLCKIEGHWCKMLNMGALRGKPASEFFVTFQEQMWMCERGEYCCHACMKAFFCF